MLSPNEMKQRVATKATHLVTSGMTIGLGSGSTMNYFIAALANRLKEGLSILAVPTSSETTKLAEENGIPLQSLNEAEQIHLTIDGADEIDLEWNLIKGGGGALLQEKLVASYSGKLVIIADHSKLVQTLGKYPLPVEAIPYGWRHVQRSLQTHFKIPVHLRQKNGKPFVTDHGHYILDCHFGKIDDAVSLNQQLSIIPGIVETGLFIDMVHAIHIGYPDGSVREFQKKS